MIAEHSVYPGVFTAVLQAAEQFGAPRHQLLRAIALEEEQLLQSDQRFPVEKLLDLFALADQLTNNPDIGLTIGRITYLTGLNLQLYMGTICRTFRDYLLLMPSLLKIKGDIGEVLTRKDGNIVWLEWRPMVENTGQQRYLSDTILSATAMVVNSLCVFPIDIVEARLTYSKPVNTAKLESVFGAQLLFDQPVSGIAVTVDTLHYRMVTQDYDFGPSSTITKLIAQSHPNDTFLVSLKQSISNNLPEGEVSLDKVARELNVSRRTLQRRLAERGTQFSQVLQDVRIQLAKGYLSDRHLGIAEIAFLLGYADQGSFSSAFKGWYGVSPREYRVQA